jgi:murein DD-endopeptidase MepM/ murein hydrolase activator NlpD
VSGAWLTHPCAGWPISQPFGVNRKWYPPFTLRNGQRWPGGHEGVDYACPPGTPIRAAHDGLITGVTRVPAVKRLLRRTQPPYGEHLRLETQHDGQRVTTIYAHLDRLAPWVKPGLPVEAGTIIGWSGGTGRVLREPGYHLHFGVNVNDWPVDPEPWLLPETA